MLHLTVAGRFAHAGTPGAFDDAADFRADDLIGWVAARGRPVGPAQLWLDRGDEDPCHAADEIHRLGIRMHVWPGDHNGDYWNAHWRDYLTFYSRALAACAAPRGQRR